MDDTPDDVHRLIHETLSLIGWDADPATIARGVKRLDFGLPAEDEFSVICSWLGKCELIHKLDQHQIPASSREKYQVPDLMACYSGKENSHPVLIEVKNSSKNTLSFRPDYLERLQSYADLLKMPLLIAWKFKSLWILFEVRHLKKAVTNFNISYQYAMLQNLMGSLAGDVAYVLGKGVGIHIRNQKDKLISVEENDDEFHEYWQMRVSDVVFTDRDGQEVKHLSPDVQSLLTTCRLEEEQEHFDDHFWFHWVAKEEYTQFGHMALVSLLEWSKPTGTDLSWRREARKEKLNTIEDFRAALSLGLKEGVVNYVFEFLPHDMPDFLQD